MKIAVQVHNSKQNKVLLVNTDFRILLYFAKEDDLAFRDQCIVFSE